MLSDNIPALQVVLPLIAAPLCALMPSRSIAWLLTFIVSLVVFALSVTLLGIVFGQGPLTYAMGGWAAPFGIEYRVDYLTSFFLVLVSAIGVFVVLYGYQTVEEEVNKRKHGIFFAVYLLCLTGLLGMIMTNDAFNIYVFLEISSLATYALIAMGRDRRALVSSFEYLVLGTIGATFILIAIGLLYMMTGTLNITDLSQKIPMVEHTGPVKAALAFFVVGLLLKIAVFPLHLWLVNSYTNAPSFVSSFLSATATKVSIYVLIRITYSLFGSQFSFEILPVGTILLALGILAVFIGAMAAIFQKNVKRMLAYSSVSQIGYILIGVGLYQQTALQAALLHIFSHAFAKGALFMAVGIMVLERSGGRFVDLKGIGKTMPFTSLAFVISGLSLIGTPLTGGFISKWYLLQASFEKGFIGLFIFVIFSSLLAVVYVWKFVEMAYFSEVPKKVAEVKIQKTTMIALWGLTITTIVIGIYTSPLISTTQIVSEYLSGLVR